MKSANVTFIAPCGTGDTLLAFPALTASASTHLPISSLTLQPDPREERLGGGGSQTGDGEQRQSQRVKRPAASATKL